MFEGVAVEDVRRYWDQRPCNIRHSPREVGTREYFDEVEKRKYFVEPHIPRFAQFERWKGKRVLEIGCGIGTDTVSFARAGAQVTAVDLSEQSLRVARQRVALFGLDNVKFVAADAERLPEFVPPEPYDLVYSFGVIHHMPHPEAALRHFSSYVRPGSEIKVMVYNRRSWKVFWILMTCGHGAFWRLERIVAENSEAQTGCPVTYTYSRRQFRKILEGLGYRVTDMFVDHIFPWRIRDYVQYRYVKNWYFRWMPEAAFHRLERMLGWHLCVTATVPQR